MSLSTETPRLLRRQQVEDQTGFKRSSIYAKIKEGNFPAPISFGSKCVRWLQEDISNWIRQQANQGHKKLARTKGDNHV